MSEELLEYDVVVLGAGISGIGAAYYLSTRSDVTFKVLEAKCTFGGTWELFKYPGIRSDSDMFSFSYAFHPWVKPQRFGNGDEILEYLKEVLTAYELEQYIKYNQRVLSAEFSTIFNRWTITTTTGTVYSSKHIIFGTGYYDHDAGYLPKFPGINSYKGQLIHPQKWPDNVQLKDKKITVIGSGATAITLLPSIAKAGGKVTMLQRSPT